MPAATDREGASGGTAGAISPRDLALRFCSLGDNCEVGVAQRLLGAEPIDLFRWGNTPAERLIALLRADFEGFGAPDRIHVIRAHGEYVVHDRRYDLIWHSWTRESEMTAEAVLDRERRRIPFLVRKLREELRQGRRVFVVRRRDGFGALAGDLHTAIRAFGRAPLLLVSEKGETTLEQVGDGLFDAGFPKLSQPSCVPATTDRAAWKGLFTRVLAQIDRSPPVDGAT